MSVPYEFSLPILIKFGCGESSKVGAIAKERGWNNTIIITDNGVANAGLLKGIKESLNLSRVQYTIFDEVEPNPKSSGVEKATRLLKEKKCSFVIGVGGGSSLDTAKATALLATNPGKPSDYAQWAGQAPRVFNNHLLPLVTIPTTAGTGSEVDFWAGISDSDLRKMDLGQAPLYPGGPYLGATISIVDPLLTVTLPPKQTAATGIDALAHAIDAYTSKISNPHASALAQDAIELVSKNLRNAFANGKNVEARENMLLAANLAGICMNSVPILGADHALALAMGDIYHDTTHGVAVALFAPAAMEFNAVVNPSKYAKIAFLMGQDVSGLSAEKAAMKSVDALRELVKDLNLPTNLSSVGVKKEDLPAIAKNATQKVDIEGNPRQIGYDDLLKMIERIYE
jgi:alcohol dehydrogenase class IV